MGFKISGNLLHQVLALEYMQGFLLRLPVIGTHDHEGLAGSQRHLERLVPANHLFHNPFQVISELVDTDGIHKNHQDNGLVVQDVLEIPTRPGTAAGIGAADIILLPIQP